MSPVFAPPLTPVGQVICTQPGAYSFLGTKQGSTTATNTTTRAGSIWVPEPVILDRIGCEVITAGEAGCVLRLGIWAAALDHTIGLPGDLVLDAGTVNGASNTVQEITINQVLSPGQYFLSLTCQLAPTTTPVIRTATELVSIPIANTAADISPNGLPGVSRGDAGALASTWGTSVSRSGNLPRIFVRVV